MRLSLETRFAETDYAPLFGKDVFAKVKTLARIGGLASVFDDTTCSLLCLADERKKLHYLWFSKIPSGRVDFRNTSIRYNLAMEADWADMKPWVGFFAHLKSPDGGKLLNELGTWLDSHVANDGSLKDGFGEEALLAGLESLRSRPEHRTPAQRAIGRVKERPDFVISSIVETKTGVEEALAAVDKSVEGAFWNGHEFMSLRIEKKKDHLREALSGAGAVLDRAVRHSRTQAGSCGDGSHPPSSSESAGGGARKSIEEPGHGGKKTVTGTHAFADSGQHGSHAVDSSSGSDSREGGMSRQTTASLSSERNRKGGDSSGSDKVRVHVTDSVKVRYLLDRDMADLRETAPQDGPKKPSASRPFMPSENLGQQ